jgi:pSer/pThr/pTyr-binding forkhead associated (FHA) protein
MTAKPSSKPDFAAPSLNVKYGNAARKQFLLDQGSTVMGRSRGCDVELESGEISSVHCVITRSSDGLVIRDLNSRSGTKVNGERIRAAVTLRDADVVQVGPFAFEVTMPRGTTPVADLETALADAKKQMARMETSRERIAEMALSLRKRLAVERAARRIAPGNEKSAEIEEAIRALADRQADLEHREAQLQKTERALKAQRDDAVRQQDVLQAQVEAHEQQIAKFEADQRAFDQDREGAIQELSALQDHLEKRQEELTRQQAKTEEEIKAAYQQLEKACGQGRAAATTTPDADSGETQRRKCELSSFAHYLRQYRQRLHERSTAIQAGEKELNDAWGGLLEAQDRLLDEQRRLATVRENLDRQSVSPFDAQGAQIGALLDSLARLYAQSRQQQDAELRALRQAFERMSGNVDVTPAPVRCPSPLLGGDIKSVTPVGPRRGKLTERVNIAALLDRLGDAKS